MNTRIVLAATALLAGFVGVATDVNAVIAQGGGVAIGLVYDVQ